MRTTYLVSCYLSSLKTKFAECSVISDRHPSYRRQQETPVRVSRLMQRLALEDSQEADATHPEPRRRVIEYAYVRPRSTSRGRTITRQRSPPGSRSPTRRRYSAQPSYHKQPYRREVEFSPSRYRHRNESRESLNRRQVNHRAIAGVTQHLPSRSRQHSRDRGRLSSDDADLTFGGRVRHVRVSDRLG